MRKLFKSLSVLAFTFLFSASALAVVVEIETNDDVNGLNATPVTESGTVVIKGAIGDQTGSSARDVDLWKFNLGNGVNFSIGNSSISKEVDATPGVGLDTLMVLTLYLEDPTVPAFPVKDGLFPVVSSRPLLFQETFGFTTFQAGTYYLGVSLNGNLPHGGAGLVFTDPNNWYDSGIGGIDLGYYAGSQGGSYDYEITLSNVQGIAAVPLPAAVWMFGAGLLSMVGFARRKRRNL